MATLPSSTSPPPPPAPPKRLPQDVLTKNISCLFKTAKLELERKDQTIADLQQQLQRQDPCPGDPRAPWPSVPPQAKRGRIV